jgi:hypothetical protein
MIILRLLQCTLPSAIFSHGEWRGYIRAGHLAAVRAALLICPPCGRNSGLSLRAETP